MTTPPLPMLASKGDVPLERIKFPKYISPKLDGVRAMVHNGVVYSRSLKPIPNKHVQMKFGRREFEGFDGELIVWPATDPHVFSNTMSGVMKVEGTPDVVFHAFDRFDLQGLNFQERYATIPVRAGSLECVSQVMVHNVTDLKKATALHLELGYEGSMLRDPFAAYKHGRATDKAQDLMKLKVFADAEAVVIGTDEMMRNLNEFDTNVIKKRSTKASGLKGAEMLGALKVRGINAPFKSIEFSVGSGFTEAQRKELWGQKLDGLIIKYRYFPGGVDVRPRFPVFVGFRDKRDL